MSITRDWLLEEDDVLKCTWTGDTPTPTVPEAVSDFPGGKSTLPKTKIADILSVPLSHHLSFSSWLSCHFLPCTEALPEMQRDVGASETQAIREK